MIDTLLTFFRGLRVLRHPELVRRLGEIRAAESDIEELRRRNPEARISSDAIVDSWREGTLQLAPGAQVERGTILNLGDAHNGYGSLIVGERTWIGQYNNLRLAGGTTIRIGA
ncbi:MAG TPA: hypothetical protein VJ032_15055, partial [Thermoanaerobaculia bacterium]|nr:hypothetical protein [Thermoanaerobaculia bacterium]